MVVIFRVHRALSEKLAALDRLQQETYTCECHVEEAKETVLRLKTQWAKLERQKAMAVEARQLQKAAEAASQMDSVKATLEEAERALVDYHHAADASKKLLHEERQKTEAFRGECAKTQDQRGLLHTFSGRKKVEKSCYMLSSRNRNDNVAAKIQRCPHAVAANVSQDNDDDHEFYNRPSYISVGRSRCWVN